MIVLDASAIVAVLLEPSSGAEAVRERIAAPGQSLHIPHLADLEVLHVFRRYALRGTLSDERSDEALRDFSDFAFARYPHSIFLERIWELRQNVTAYDAAYISLAEALGAPLITLDSRLAAAPGIRASVEVF